MVEYYTVPKIIGYAESAWAREREWETIENVVERNAKIQQGWNVFANTIAQREYPKLAKLNDGYNYRVAPPGAKVVEGILYANVNLPGLEIRYTVDGVEPTKDSPLYTDPVKVKLPVQLRVFDKTGKASRSIRVEEESEQVSSSSLSPITR